MISRSYRLLTDERLARLAGDGNDPAFAALHHRYDAVLHGYTRSIARDAEDAADALQNAWIAALIALRADRRSAPVRPWLFRIAHNSAVDVLRRRSAAVRAIDRGGHLLAAVGADEQFAHREDVAEVVADMRELPTNQRAALVMRELADLGYSEIAIALATSEGNARQLVFAAREGLKESRAGRALPCEAVRGVLVRADGRELRRRRLRAHLSTCHGCRDFAATVARPRPAVGARKVAGYAPAPALLQGIFAAVGGGSGVGAGGSFAGLAKGAVAASLLVAGVGGGELVVRQGDGDGVASVKAAVERVGPRAGGAIAAASSGSAGGGSRTSANPSAAAPVGTSATLVGAAAKEATPAGSTKPVADRGASDRSSPAAAEVAITEPETSPRAERGPASDSHRAPGGGESEPADWRSGARDGSSGGDNARSGEPQTYGAPGGGSRYGGGSWDRARGASAGGGRGRDCPPGSGASADAESATPG